MNPLIQFRTTTLPLLIPLLFVCFALASAARAVSPAPDGGYANGNTAEGTDALFSLTTGVGNTAIGFRALNKNTTGSLNSAVGDQALFSNTIGNNNTANGVAALYSNTTIGVDSGHDNTADGIAALLSNTTGANNTAVGSQALFSNTTAPANTAVGFQALANNTASNNTAMGAGALHLSQAGGNNTAVGFNALGSEVTGISNVAVGSGALANAIHGFNIAVGADAGSAVTTALGVIAIGSSGANVGGSCFIGNIRGVTTNNANAIPVVIDSFGQLGTLSSSHRFKKDIKPMEGTSGSVLDLKPVTFHYKNDKSNIPQFGLIAEEVAAVNPDLVIRDEKGEIYTVRYEAVNAMLLNEFLKEHRTVEELKKEIAALTATVQKVSAQVEMGRAAPQVVENNQ